MENDNLIGLDTFTFLFTNFMKKMIDLKVKPIATSPRILYPVSTKNTLQEIQKFIEINPKKCYGVPKRNLHSWTFSHNYHSRTPRQNWHSRTLRQNGTLEAFFDDANMIFYLRKQTTNSTFFWNQKSVIKVAF